MTETMTASIDAKQWLLGFLSALVDMTTKDIQAMTDEEWTKSYGGCSRAAGALIADAVTNMHFVTDVLKGGESNAYAGMKSLGEQYASREAAVSGLKAAAADFSAALSGASTEKLLSEVMAPWQMPTPVFMLCQIAVSHIWYHDGQLNFMQCLNGDENVQWMM